MLKKIIDYKDYQQLISGFKDLSPCELDNLDLAERGDHFGKLISSITEIDPYGKVMFVGAGGLVAYPIGCALNPNVLSVDIVQPNIYNDGFLKIAQNDLFNKRVNCFKTHMLNTTGRDPIGSKIDSASFQGYLGEVAIPKNTYSFVFLIRVLNDPQVFATKILDDTLPLLKNNATIVIGDFDREHSEKDFIRYFDPRLSEYCTLKKEKVIEAYMSQLHVFSFKRK